MFFVHDDAMLNRVNKRFEMFLLIQLSYSCNLGMLTTSNFALTCRTIRKTKMNHLEPIYECMICIFLLDDIPIHYSKNIYRYKAIIW